MAACHGHGTTLPPRGEGNAWRCAAEEAALDLAVAQRAMAPLLLLANDVFLALEALATRPSGLGRRSVSLAVERAAGRYLRAIARSAPAMRRSAGRLLRHGTRVVTYSASAAVEEILRTATSRRRRLEVLLSETRPAREGVPFAERLARGGIRVTLATDAALPSSLDGASILLVGADAISREGVINKIGTSTLAEIASARKVPVVVAAGPEKFLPAALAAFIHDEDRSRREIYRGKVQLLRVANPTFDFTPLQRVDRFVTAWGLLAREEVTALLSGMKYSARLQRRLVSRLGRPAARATPRRRAGRSRRSVRRR